jgi:outer membrane protein
MKKAFFSATLAVFFTVNVEAAFTFTPQKNNNVGLYLGGQIWQSDASGVFGKKNTLIDFNLKKEQQINYFVAIEHPYPLLPNIRISSTALNTTGKTNSTQEYSDNNKTSHVDVETDANFNVSYIDYTLYYQLFDNDLFSFDLGLTARDFDGAVTVTETTIIETIQDDVTDWHESCLPLDENGIPLNESCHILPTTSSDTHSDKIKTNEIVTMFYVATNISLPLTGLSVFAQGDFSLIDDHSLYDYQVGLNYNLINSKVVDFNVTLGYRVVKIAFEDLNNLYSGLELKGAFVGVITHF